MPTSGDLKSGDSLFCTTTRLPGMTTAPPPPTLPTNRPGLGHHMKSYMKYMRSIFAFIGAHFNVKIILSVNMQNVPETVK